MYIYCILVSFRDENKIDLVILGLLIPVLLTGAQLSFVSYWLFISVFEADLTFWFRLRNRFLKNKFGSRIIFYSHVRNILRLFDGSANFLLTRSEKSMVISNKLIYTSCLMSCRATKDLGY